MKVIHLAYSDYIGGASIAANRIHLSLLEENIDSKIWVDAPSKKISKLNKFNSSLEKMYKIIRLFLVFPLLKLIKTDIPIHHSISILSSQWHKKINNSDADVVNIHWVQREMISIKDISKIKKPIVWTLHDMWAFCGAEHYTNDNRWREGYNSNNRPSYESGIDLNQWTWRRKKKYWKNPIQIITPSKWLANCVQESKLMSNWPVSVIPYPLNIKFFKPMDKKIARNQLKVPLDIPLILFGAIGGVKDYRKGFDLLVSSLEHLKNDSKTKKFQLVVFGQEEPKSPPKLGFLVHYVGYLNNDISLRLIYNSADAMIVPSRQDNLPNTCLEAQACGVPIVAFNTGGLSDIIEHKKTGYLAKAFDTKDLANGITYVLDQIDTKKLGKNARQKALEKYLPKTIAEKYKSIYERVLK